VQDNDDTPKRSAASISIAYLRAAAEKKKARDREFARELFREENEFKKKISVKIDQANKMMAAIGSTKSFGPAPDRDGIHMIKVMDPVGGDRVISVEIFHILSLFIACTAFIHVHPPKIKPADRSQVQEELRSVLEGTIELTKVLQEQLHELKLKGWNVTPRS
ncbi:hypothetical protein PHYSODRAFT_470331, partial [Phytophthora sojae]